MNIFIDTETSGMIKHEDGSKKRKFPEYHCLPSYDGCRIVSICWLVCQHDKIVEQGYYIIKPNGFEISEESIKIHGITQDEADKYGVSIEFALSKLELVINNCSAIVAHNIMFDINVILSECFRLSKQSMIDKMLKKHHKCTMLKGKDFMDVKKYPRLGELYKYLYNEELENAHNALADTVCCFKCYLKMFPIDKSVYFFKNKEIKLTDEQQKIVYEDLNTHMIVVASAGSGKTTTTLTRIKYLLDQGINDNEIMLTTFTWDAAHEMKTKLNDILGYKSNITVGTIDGIARSYIKDDEMRHVGEYSYEFLKLIRDKKSYIDHYKYLFVDEFQDINDVQFEIIKEFYKNKTIVFGVGDDAQNIYTFRGSNVKYMLDFTKFFKNSKCHMLTRNFRSTQEIVNLANASMENQDEKIAKTMISNVEEPYIKPTVKYCQSSRLQTLEIIELIKKSLEKYNPENIAILSPINQTLYPIEEILTKENIPHNCLENKSDVRLSKQKGNITLCTIHKAKGLEWDVVIMINMSDDIIPKVKSLNAVREDRRLFYVGITRARKELHIFYTGNINNPYVTRYISEIPRKYYNFINYNPKYLESNSIIGNESVDLSINKLVDYLDGEDFIKLKEQGLFTNYEKINVHDSYEYSNLVIKEGLVMDFCNYLKTIIFYKLNPEKAAKYAHQILSHLILDNNLYGVYKNYIKNIKKHEFNIDDNRYKELISLLKKQAKIFNLEPSQILVYNREIYSNVYLTNLRSNLNTKTENIYNILWELSKCERIVMENRKRLMFRENYGIELYNENKNLIDDISTKFLESLDRSTIRCNISLFDNNYTTDIDMIVDKDLYIIKPSSRNELDIKLIIQAILQSEICKKNKIDVNTYKIYNPIKGIIYTFKNDDHLKSIVYNYFTNKFNVQA